MGELSPWQIRRNPELAQIEGYGYSEDSNDSGSFHLRDYWRVLVKWRRVIFLSFVIIVFIGSYFVLTATPLYTARATLKIEQDPVEVLL